MMRSKDNMAECCTPLRKTAGARNDAREGGSRNDQGNVQEWIEADCRQRRAIHEDQNDAAMPSFSMQIAQYSSSISASTSRHQRALEDMSVRRRVQGHRAGRMIRSIVKGEFIGAGDVREMFQAGQLQAALGQGLPTTPRR